MRNRVSFDSNAWERIFDTTISEGEPIRAALMDGRIRGFICDAGFRIEAIRKSDRASYFAQPLGDLRQEGIVMHDGKPHWKMSVGPVDERHPGLPPPQARKLQNALAAGVQLMRGLAWTGLPSPQGVLDPRNFVFETAEQGCVREQRQIDVFAHIEARGVGKAAFDKAGGWNLGSRGQSTRKDFAKRVLNGRMASWYAPMLLIKTTYYVQTIVPEQRASLYSVR
jgi:hypothetical protein